MKTLTALCALFLLFAASSVVLAEAKRHDCAQVPVHLYVAESVDVEIDTGGAPGICLDVEAGTTGAHATIPFTVKHNVMALVTGEFVPPDVPCPNVSFFWRFQGPGITNPYAQEIILPRPNCTPGSGTFTGQVFLSVDGVTIDLPANCYKNGYLKICVDSLCPPVVCCP